MYFSMVLAGPNMILSCFGFFGVFWNVLMRLGLFWVCFLVVLHVFGMFLHAFGMFLQGFGMFLHAFGTILHGFGMFLYAFGMFLHVLGVFSARDSRLS